MKKHITMNIVSLAALAIVLAITYYFLISDNFLHISISSIINYSSQLAASKHRLIVGLLPIYIASILFGAAIAGIYLVKRVRYLFF